MSGAVTLSSRNAQPTRIVPFRVIVCGLMRTGTSSMKAALQSLGYHDVYHMTNVVGHLEDCNDWVKALDAKYDKKGVFNKEDWDRLLGKSQAICDLPAALFATELAEAYPDAKVIILNRDFEAWYKSCNSTVFRFYGGPPKSKIRLAFRTITHYLLPRGFLNLIKLHKSIETLVFKGPMLNEKERARKFFNDYYDGVRSHFPKDQILEYNVQHGWKPLCEYLEVPVPTVVHGEQRCVMPFPRMNDATAFANEYLGASKPWRRQVIARTGLLFFVLAVMMFFVKQSGRN